MKTKPRVGQTVEISYLGSSTMCVVLSGEGNSFYVCLDGKIHQIRYGRMFPEDKQECWYCNNPPFVNGTQKVDVRVVD